VEGTQLAELFGLGDRGGDRAADVGWRGGQSEYSLGWCAVAHQPRFISIAVDASEAETILSTTSTWRTEGFALVVCHVIVNRTSEAVELAERAPARVIDTRLRNAAFVRLADEHLDRAYRLARAILRDPVEAQDATHDAFVQAWRRWDTLRDRSRFEAWFDRILVNTCRNRLRSTHRRATDISAEVALATGDHAGGVEDRDVVGAAIAALSPDHQAVSRCATTVTCPSTRSHGAWASRQGRSSRDSITR
jgi:RNA polymerase sigma factor (sigma-70 family)